MCDLPNLFILNTHHRPLYRRVLAYHDYHSISNLVSLDVDSLQPFELSVSRRPRRPHRHYHCFLRA